MPIEIQAPDGTIARFPDGTADDVIKSVMRKSFGGPEAGPPKPQTSAWSAAGDGALQGVSFGFADEAEAGLKALGGKLMDPMGPSFSERYNEKVGEVRDRLDASAEQHPLAYYGGEIGSSLLVPGGLAKLGVKSAVKAASGQGLRAVATAGAKEGAAYGAAYGAGKSEGDVGDRVGGAIGGGLMGGALGGAAPVVVEGVIGATAPIRNTAQAIFNKDAAGDARLAKAFADDAATKARKTLSPEDAQKEAGLASLAVQGRAGDDFVNMDLGGEKVRALARSAANQSPEARELLENALDPRYKTQTVRAQDFIQSLVPSNANAPQTREALQEAARKARQPLYDAAYKAGEDGIETPTMQMLSRAPIMETVRARALTNIKNKLPTRQNTPIQGPNGPTLAYWDQVQRELRALRDMAFRSGDSEQAAVLGDLRKTLLNELDTNIPEFAQARGAARTFAGAEDALEAGENFVTMRFRNEEIKQAFKKMTNPEIAAFREGFASKLIQTIRENRDGQNIVINLAKSPNERERIEMALGPNAARQLEAWLYGQELQNMSRNAVKSNSTTARQLMEMGLAGGVGGMITSGNPFDPQGFLAGALIRYGAGKGQAHIENGMAQRIAEGLVSKDPNKVRVAVQQAAYSPALNIMRSIMQAIPQQAGRVSGGVMAQEQEQ